MITLRFGSAGQAGLDPERIELLRQRAAGWVASGSQQCIVLLVARHGVICLHEAWGKLAPRADSPPAKPDSIFWIASNSKPITATAIMMLVEDGLLGLNRPVVNYVPELCGDRIDDVTLRHLLTHTSGFDYDETTEFINSRLETEPLAGDHRPFSERYLEAGYAITPSKKPGSVMTYNNYNYALLADVVRRVSDRPFWEFARERIFERLGMRDSWYRYETRFKDRLAHLDPAYPPDVGIVVDDAFERDIFDSFSGAWGLKSTALDYAKFVQMILNGGVYGDARLLQRRTVHEMTRNQIPGIGTDFFGAWHSEANWGLGIRVLGDDRWNWYDGSLTPTGTLSHGGAAGTQWWADPANDLLGIHFSVCRDVDYERREMHVNIDLVQDMVTAAIAD